MVDTGFNVYDGLCNLRAVQVETCLHFPITNTPPIYTGHGTAPADPFGGQPTPITPKTGWAYQYSNNEGGANSIVIKINYSDIAETELRDGCNNIYFFRPVARTPKDADITLSLGNISREVLATIADARVLTGGTPTANVGTEFHQSGDFPWWWIEADRRYTPTGTSLCTTPFNRVTLLEARINPPEELFNLSKDVPAGYEFTGSAKYVKLPVAGYTGPWGTIPAAQSIGFAEKTIAFEQDLAAVAAAVTTVGLINV